MTRVKVFLNDVEKKVHDAKVTKEAERAVDEGEFDFRQGVTVSENDKVNYIQDFIDLVNLKGSWNFENSSKDESGFIHDGVLNPTLGSPIFNFNSTTGWTKTGTYQDITGGQLVWRGSRFATQHSEVYDLGAAISNTLWVMKYKLKVTSTISGPDIESIFIGLSSISTGSAATAQDFIGAKFNFDAPSTTVFSDDYTTNAGWTQVGTKVTVDLVAPNETYIEGQPFADNDRVHKSLGIVLNDTKWKADFDVLFAGISGHTSGRFVIFALASGTSTPQDSNQDAVIVQYSMGSAGLQLAYKDGAAAIVESGGIALTQGVRYYCSFERTSGTNAKLSIFSDAARTTHVAGSPINQTIPQTVGSLNILIHGSEKVGSVGGQLSAQIDNTVISEGVAGRIQARILDTDGANLNGIVDATYTTGLDAGRSYWIRVTRTSATVYTMDIFEDQQYSKLLITLNGTVLSSTDTLRYIVVCGDNINTGGDGNFAGTIDDVEIFNGTGDIPSYVVGKQQTSNAIDLKSTFLQRVTIANHADFNVSTTTDFSVVVLLLTTSTAAGGIWYKGREGAGNKRISIKLLSDGTPQVDFSDGTTTATITTATTINNGLYRALVVNFDRDGTMKLYIDGVQSGNTPSIAAIGSPDTTDPIQLGAILDSSGNPTSYLTCKIELSRFYSELMTELDILKFNDAFLPTQQMRFGGRVWKVKQDLDSTIAQCKGFGKSLAETDIKFKIYENVTPEDIIEDLIEAFTPFTYIGRGASSGVLMKKYLADGKLIDIVRDLAALSDKTFYTNSLNLFIFEIVQNISTSLVYEHGKGTIVKISGYDDTELVNDLLIIGENKKFDTVQFFSGDGATKVFILSNVPTSLRLLLSGVEQTPTTNYTLDAIGKKITFVIPPPTASNNVEARFQYESPLYIRQARQSSIDQYGTRGKRLIMPWLKDEVDGKKYATGFLNRFKDAKRKVTIDLPTLDFIANENNVVTVKNSQLAVDGTFVIKSLKFMYPVYKTEINVGEFDFSYLEVDKSHTEKIHDLEDALLVNKEIKDYGSLEETIPITETIIKTILIKATYNKTTTTYNKDDVYSV